MLGGGGVNQHMENSICFVVFFLKASLINWCQNEIIWCGKFGANRLFFGAKTYFILSVMGCIISVTTYSKTIDIYPEIESFTLNLELISHKS